MRSLLDLIELQQYEKAIALIKGGADVQLEHSYGKTALHCAAHCAHALLVSTLLKHGAIVDAEDHEKQTPLLWTIRYQECFLDPPFSEEKDRLECLKILIQKGADIHHCDRNGENILHYATQWRYSTIVEHLLTVDPSLCNVKSKRGETALHWAAFRAHPPLVSLLLRYRAHVDAENRGKQTPLLWAAGYDFDFQFHYPPSNEADRLECVRSLLRAGANRHHCDIDGENAVHYASRMGYQLIIQDIINRCLACLSGAVDLIIARNNEGETALHIAAQWAHPKILENILIFRDVEVDVENSDKETSLLKAIRGGSLHREETRRLECVRILLAKNADVLHCDAEGNSVLHYAIEKSYWQIVQHLLTVSPSLISLKNNEGETALHWAAFRSQPPLIDLLQQYGAVVDAQNTKKETPLLWAIGLSSSFAEEKKILQCVKMLSNAGGDFSHCDEKGRNILHYATEAGYMSIIEHLLTVDSSLCHVRSNHGETALHVAADRIQPKIISFLLQNGSEVDAQNTRQETPLLCAIGRISSLPSEEKRRLECVRILLKHGANIRHSDRNNENALHYAVRNNYLSVVRHLVSADPSLCLATSSRGKQAATLHQVAQWALPSAICILLEHGADVDAVDEKKQTPLLKAIGYLECDLDSPPSNEKDRLECLKILIQKGANVRHCDKNGKSILHYATEWRYSTIVEHLLTVDPSLCHVKSKRGETALHWAAFRAHPPLVSLLLRYRAHVDAENTKNETPLFWAIGLASPSEEKQRLECIRILLDAGADIRHCDENYRNILYRATESRQVSIVQYLLSVDPSLCLHENTSGSTPMTLHEAAQWAAPTTAISILLQQGAQVNAEDEFKRTPLLCVMSWNSFPSESEKDRLECMKTLINKGADINHCDEDGKNVLHYAIENCYWLTAQHLLTICPSLCHVKDKLGDTALHRAAIKANPEIISILLNCGAEVDTTNNAQRTPLVCAIGNNSSPAEEKSRMECLKILLEAGASVRQEDSDQMTALHWAANQVQPNIVSLLLKYSPETEVKDEMLRTPLLQALGSERSKEGRILPKEKGRLECIRTLLKCGSNIRHQDLTGMDALHYAMKNEYHSVVRYLLTVDHTLWADNFLSKKATFLLFASGIVLPNVLSQFFIQYRGRIMKPTLIYAIASEENLFADDENPPNERDRFQCVEILMTEGANSRDCDIYGDSALHHSSRKGYLSITKHLLTVDPSLLEIRNSRLETALDIATNEVKDYLQKAEPLLNMEKASALLQVAEHGNADFIHLLVKSGAPVDAQDDMLRTPLLLTVSHGSSPSDEKHRLECVKILVEAGANIRHQDLKKNTVLHYCIEKRYKSIAGYLLSVFYSPLNTNIKDVNFDSHLLDMKNENGRTPLDLAPVDIEAYIKKIMLLLNQDDALLHAITEDMACVIPVLSSRFAKIDPENENGKIPYDLANIRELKDLLCPHYHEDHRYVHPKEDFLSSGSFGNVFRVQHKVSKKYFAMKLIEVRGQDLKDERREVTAMMKLCHPNVVKLKEFWMERENLIIVMELCKESLRNWLFIRNNNYRESQKTSIDRELQETINHRIFVDIAAGVAYIHENKFIHRDLKPENILINGEEDSVTAKVADLGLAVETRNLSASSAHTAYKGTQFYMAPEIASPDWKEETNYTSKVDVYSMALIWTEILIPENGVRQNYFGFVKKKKFEAKPMKKHIERYPAQFQNIGDMISLNHRERPTSADVHAFAKSMLNDRNKIKGSFDCFDISTLSDIVLKDLLD